jgi:hypothetical protein
MHLIRLERANGLDGTRIRGAMVDDDWITLALADGRRLRLPTVFSTPLLVASDAERRAWRVSITGRSVRWPALGVVLGVRRAARARACRQPSG